MDRILKIAEPHLPETELWASFLLGNQGALSSIAGIHYSALYNYGYRFSADEDFVKDCLQELFTDLWERREKLSEVAAVKSYLLKALRHRMINESIRLKRFKMQDIPFLSEVTEQSIESVIIENDVLNEQSGRLKQIIAQLTSRQQEIIYLRFYQGLEFTEITQILGMERQSVANLLHRALKEIREKWLSSDLPLKILAVILSEKLLNARYL